MPDHANPPPFTVLGNAEAVFHVAGLPFSPAIRIPAGCDLVFISGCPGVPDGENDSPSLEAEVRRAFSYLAQILSLAGAGLEHVVSVTKFLTNVERDHALVTTVMRELFPVLPTSTTVEVSRLVPRGLSFEVNAIAAVPAVLDQSG